MGFSFGNLGHALTGSGGAGGVNTGPTNHGSFMSRLGGQVPGMLNGMAQNYGDPSLQGAAKGSSSLLGVRKPAFPGFNPGIQSKVMPGQNMGMPTPPQPPPMSGINTGPSNMSEMPMNGPTESPMSMNMMGSRNTGNGGISGGLFGNYARRMQNPFGM